MSFTVFTHSIQIIFTYALIFLLGLEAFTLYACHVENIGGGQRLFNGVKDYLGDAALLQISHNLLGHAQSVRSDILQCDIVEG